MIWATGSRNWDIFGGGIWLPSPALFAMAAVSAAVHNLLQRHLPTRADDEIDGLVQEFRHWFRGMPDGSSVEEVVDGAMDIADELFDASILNDANAFRAQWMAIVDGIHTPAARWDWDGTNWARLRNRVRAQVALRPAAPTPAPKPTATTKQEEYYWGKQKPAGMKEGDKVMPGVIKKAMQEGLLDKDDDPGFVAVGSDMYIVTKKKKVDNPPDAAGGASVGLSRFQETTLFAKEYERCAEKVLRDVAHRSPSVEQYVKSAFAEYAVSDREKYDQLVLSGLTADKLLKAYDGKPKEEVYADDALELHLYNIAQEEYVQRTGNIVGARAVNGVQSFLLPQSVCDAAAKHTQAQSKLQNSMQQIGGGAAQRNRAQRAPFVPVSERLCYGCKKPGHVLADCPNLSDAEKIAKLKEINAAKGAGKGKGRS